MPRCCCFVSRKCPMWESQRSSVDCDKRFLPGHKSRPQTFVPKNVAHCLKMGLLCDPYHMSMIFLCFLFFRFFADLVPSRGSMIFFGWPVEGYNFPMAAAVAGWRRFGVAEFGLQEFAARDAEAHCGRLHLPGLVRFPPGDENKTRSWGLRKVGIYLQCSACVEFSR